MVQTSILPGLGIRQSDMSLVLGATGLKVNLTRTLLLNAAVLFPLTENGLHNRTTASIGVDYTSAGDQRADSQFVSVQLYPDREFRAPPSRSG